MGGNKTSLAIQAPTWGLFLKGPVNLYPAYFSKPKDGLELARFLNDDLANLVNKYPKKYDEWFKGGVVINPITWDLSKESNILDHEGLLYIDNNKYSKSVKVYLTDGLLWTSVPKVPNRLFLRFIKNYHYADINLFWFDIQKNAIERVNSWVKISR